jgi:aminotransferase
MGAFYAFPNISGLGLTSQELTDMLLEQADVAVMPGTAFGAGGEGYLRICFAKSLTDLRIALENMNSVIDNRVTH